MVNECDILGFLPEDISSAGECVCAMWNDLMMSLLWLMQTLAISTSPTSIQEPTNEYTEKMIYQKK